MEFKDRYPQIELTTAERSRAHLATGIRNGALDIAVVAGEILLTNNRALSLWSERVLVVLPEGHPLATQVTAYWTDLRAEKLLISRYDPGREFEDLLISKLVALEDRLNIERHDVSHSSNRELGQHEVRSGLGPGIRYRLQSVGSDL